MSDVNITIDAAPANVEVAAAPVSVEVSAAPVSVSVATAPVRVEVAAAPIRVVVSGARGPSGISNLSQQWISLVNNWTEEPTLNGTSPVLGGEVYDYTYGATVYYRHVPDPYDPTEDAFYETYSAGVLSDLISVKGLAITP